MESVQWHLYSDIMLANDRYLTIASPSSVFSLHVALPYISRLRYGYNWSVHEGQV